MFRIIEEWIRVFRLRENQKIDQPVYIHIVLRMCGTIFLFQLKSYL